MIEFSVFEFFITFVGALFIGYGLGAAHIYHKHIKDVEELRQDADELANILNRIAANYD